MSADVTTLLDLAKRGWHVFPVDHPHLDTCVGLHGPASPCDGKRGKHPTVKFSVAATTNPQIIASWFAGPPRNVGIACKPSRLVVLDEDAPGEVERWCRDHNVTLPYTYTVTTGRGKHYHFAGPPGVEIGNGEKPFRDYDINVRGYAGTGGGYVVAPGSRHADGRIYTPDDPHAAAAPLPTALLNRLARQKPADTPAGGVTSVEAPEDPNTAKIPYKQRHTRLVPTPGGCGTSTSTSTSPSDRAVPGTLA